MFVVLIYQIFSSVATVSDTICSIFMKSWTKCVEYLLSVNSLKFRRRCFFSRVSMHVASFVSFEMFFCFILLAFSLCLCCFKLQLPILKLRCILGCLIKGPAAASSSKTYWNFHKRSLREKANRPREQRIDKEKWTRNAEKSLIILEKLQTLGSRTSFVKAKT